MNVVAAFEDVQIFLSRCNALDFLSQFSMTNLFACGDEFVDDAADIHIRSRELEFASGFYATQPLHPEGERVDGLQLEEFSTLCATYFKAVTSSLILDRIEGRSSVSSPMMSAKIESLYVRGDAYPHQFWNFAEAVYSPHSEWFRDHLGFTIADAITIAQSIQTALNDRFAKSLAASRDTAPSLVEECRAEWEATGMTLDQAINCARVQLSFGKARDMYRFSLEEITAVSGVAQEVCAAFLERLSQQPPYRNPLYPNTFTEATRALWDYNTIKERPFFTDGEAFWVFAPHVLKEVLYFSFFFDLMGDRSYRAVFESSRGKVLEQLSASFLTRVFPSDCVMLNPTYPNGEEFADVCVIFDSKLFILQCKSKGLTLAAHTGEDEAALKRDLQQAIGDAALQACKGRKFIENTVKPYLLIENRKIEIDKSIINEVILIAVTFMPLQMLATKVRDVEAELNMPHTEFPVWALPVGSLDLVTQILRSPAELLHYIRRRLILEMDEKGIHADEMDLLAFYLSQGLWLTGNDMSEVTTVGLSGYSALIDEFVFHRYQRGINVPPPQATRLDELNALVAQIESLTTPFRTDCALALLELFYEASSALMKLIGRTKQRCLDKDESITSSVGNDRPAWGISMVACPSHITEEESLDRAEAFGKLKKYARRMDKWVALGWRVGSQRDIDFAIWLDYPFKQDADTDAIVRMLF